MTRPEIIGTQSDAIATFKLVCLYGLAEAPRRHYAAPLFGEEGEPPHHNADWIWRQALREWKGKR